MALLRRALGAIGVEDRRAALASAFAASYYLAFPWMLGVAWATAISPNFATICFNVAICVWFATWPLAARCLASVALFSLSSLTYEAYWFAFIPFAALLWLTGAFRRAELAILTGSLACAQLSMIAYNRLIAILSIGTNKSFDHEWLRTLGGMWPKIISGLREIYGVTGRDAFAILLAAILACLAFRLTPRRALATLGPVIAGIAISLVLMAVAGYPVFLTSIRARTMIVISWWLAVAVALGVARISTLPLPQRRIAAAAGLAMLLLLIGGSLSESRFFVDSWSIQADILRKLPRDRILGAPGPAILVIELPSARDAAATFYSAQDLSGAIWLTDPEVAKHLAGSAPPVSWSIAVPTTGLRHVKIDQDSVQIFLCETSQLVEEYRSDHILHWRYPGQDVNVIFGTIASGCVDGPRLPP